MLSVDAIETRYGASQVLFGVSLQVLASEVVTLLGRNGMGKTTTVRSILRMTPPMAGAVRFDGLDLKGLASFQVARLGIGLVPEGRQVFPTLTVEENLLATARYDIDGRRRWARARVYDLFPALKERARQVGRTLSGGEQQMLAIGRALMTNPRLLILDEATEGLAPLVRAEIWKCLDALKAEGLAILIIDKNIDELSALADRHFVLEKGRVVWEGNSHALTVNQEITRRYLGV